MQTLLRLFMRANRILELGIRALLVAGCLVMVFALSLQVFTRYVLNLSFAWNEELSLALFTWSVMLLIALGVRRMNHVRMSLLSTWIPSGLRPQYDRVIAFLMLVFGSWLLYSGLEYVQLSADMRSASLRYPIEWLYVSVPTSGFLTVLFALESMIVPTRVASSET